MNIQQLNHDLILLVEQKIKLSQLDYSHKEYDQVEDELHDMEDDFVEEFGEFLEDILADIHDEYFKGDEVLMPTAYIADTYKKTNKDGNVEYDVDYKQGVSVRTKQFIGQETYLALVPNPVRFVLTVKGIGKKVVWNSLEQEAS